MPLTIVQAIARRRPRALRELGPVPATGTADPVQAMHNYEAMTKLLLERGHVRLPEGELIAFWRDERPISRAFPASMGARMQAIVAAIEAPDYAAVKVPALAIYAIREIRRQPCHPGTT